MNENQADRSKRLSDYTLERLALGEVTDEERARIEERLREEGEEPDEFLRRIEEIKADNEAILETYPTQMMAARIGDRFHQRQEEQRRASTISRPFYGVMGFAGAAALTAVLVFTVGQEEQTVESDEYSSQIVSSEPQLEEVVRIKGLEPSLEIWRQTQDVPELLESGARTRQDDIVQLRYNGAGAPYGVIASVSGAGTVTLHFPDSEAEDTELQSGLTFLDFGYQLNDAPEFERFFFITSEDPLDAQAIVAELERLETTAHVRGERPALSEDLMMTDIILEKE